MLHFYIFPNFVNIWRLFQNGACRIHWRSLKNLWKNMKNDLVQFVFNALLRLMLGTQNLNLRVTDPSVIQTTISFVFIAFTFLHGSFILALHALFLLFYWYTLSKKCTKLVSSPICKMSLHNQNSCWFMFLWSSFY